METFKKRQKEMRRLDKQREKAARRIERKLNPLGSAGDPSSDDIPSDEMPKDGPDSLPTAEHTTDM